MFRGQTIPLLPSLVLEPPDRKLFAADSMTLLIGPNGAGKTRAMGTLASAFAAKKLPLDEFAGFSWDMPEDIEETCAIYYTPVPYDVDIPRSGGRFQKLQPGISHEKSIQHTEVIKELESIFELDVRSKLILGDLSRGTLAQLMWRVTGSPHQKAPSVKDDWVKSFRERLISVEHDHKEARLQGYEYYSQEMEAIRKINEDILTDFSIKLREEIGPDLLLKLRSYVHARSLHNKTKMTARQLIEKIGFSLNISSGKKWGVASLSFDSTMTLLKQVATIVSDPCLNKNEYMVNDKQAHELNALKLGKIGRVALTGLSSGAAALIDQFSNIRLACEGFAERKVGKRLLLLIDEGDAFLHIHWQQNYIDYLDKAVLRLKELFDSVQVVIATHSPVLMSDFPRDCIFMMDTPDKTADVFASTQGLSHTPIASFGAPLDVVVRHAGKAGTLGTFAARVMRQLVEDIRKGVAVDARRVQMIDDPVVRQQIERMLVDHVHWANRG